MKAKYLQQSNKMCLKVKEMANQIIRS